VGPHIRSGRFGEGENVVILPGFEPRIVPARSLLAVRFAWYTV